MMVLEEKSRVHHNSPNGGLTYQHLYTVQRPGVVKIKSHLMAELYL